MTTAQILVVDDDTDACTNLADILGDLGYHIDVANRGWDALRMAESKAYDLALLDFKLPCMTGVELYRRLRERQTGLQAVLVTAFAGMAEVESAGEAGLKQVIAKPVDVRKLMPVVKEVAGEPS